MLLFHGTTLTRAQRIILNGPDPNFVEPGGKERARGFFLCPPFGPFEASGRPERYAVLKTAASRREGREEGGPAILLVDVPDEVLDLVVTDEFPLSQGFVAFEAGPGFEALMAVWRRIPKRILHFRGVSS
ncbi:MAG: hypothetical protein ACRC33_14555 [Gemmataceae bacterium]